MKKSYKLAQQLISINTDVRRFVLQLNAKKQNPAQVHRCAVLQSHSIAPAA